ncbi:MAG: hypothetical protein MJ014_00105 [Methanocorpusculum sp.]|nr:hypothetical protein [Methanocorpusculum sp.]
MAKRDVNIKIKQEGVKEATKEVDILTAKMKNLFHAAVGGTEETKTAARGLRRVGSLAALGGNVSLGTKFFQASRVGMTLGPVGAGIAVAGGMFALIQKKSEETREEWDKHMATIGAVKQEYDEFAKTVAQHADVMSKYGIQFDERYMNVLQDITQLYPEYNRQSKVADASAKVHAQAAIEAAGGVAAYKKEIESVTDVDIWRASINSTNELYGALNDLFKIVSKLDVIFDSFIRGYNTDTDTFESKTQEYLDNANKNLERLKKRRERVSVKGGRDSIDKEIEKEERHITYLRSGNLKGLGDLGYGGEQGALQVLKNFNNTKELTGVKSVAETIAEINAKILEEAKLSNQRNAPVGFWSTNLMGGIPYTTTKTQGNPQYLNGTPAVSDNVVFNPVSSGSSGSTASSNRNVTMNNTINNNIEVTNLDDPIMDNMLDRVAAKLTTKLSSGGSAF